MVGGIEIDGYGSEFRTGFLGVKTARKKFIVWSKVGVFQQNASTVNEIYNGE